MALTLHVDTERWRTQLAAAAASYPRVVTVVKGSGYGFGHALLAAEAARLGADTLAVGTYDELALVSDAFPGDLLVLVPFRTFDVARNAALGVAPPGEDPRLIHTVSRLADLQTLADGPGKPRIVVELFTSMRRHGFPPEDLPMITKQLDGVRCEGWALHLPLTTTGAHGAEVEAWIRLLEEAGAPLDRLFVSHLTPAELAALSSGHPTIDIRPRIGTKLWLSDREAYQARAHVLDVHSVRRGDRFGYRQRRVPGDGYLLVVSGGTAHGVALEAPSHVTDLRTRAKVLAASGLEATGRALSPFTVAGQRRWFAEPPHMQVSVVFLPASVAPPEVGTELRVNVGMGLTRFDQVVFD
ncbi:alanine racemase [Actinopolymorpha alba]|uniref:alanine racemase n=1 Tax=Actinopolymorpha alba TaxID=533267 RepID=UPI00035D7FB9|nr:alanine racemase [Actinopolymorpha alba]